MTNVIFCHFFGAGDPSLLGHHDDTNSNDDERPTVYTSKNFNIFSNFEFSALKNKSFISFSRKMKGMRVAILDQRVVLTGGEESLTNSTNEVLCECVKRIV